MQITNLKAFIPFALGYTAIIVGALLHALDLSLGFWIFSVGTVAFVTTRMLTLPKTDDRRTRRLYAQLMIGAICLLATAYLMFIGHNAWAITLIISAIIDLWVSFRI